MEIEVFVKPVNNTYEVQVGLSREPGSLTPVEVAAFLNFGEPLVDCGGSFDNDAGCAYTLPTDQRLFPSQFPVKQIFSLVDFGDAAIRANLYYTTLQTRLAAARTTQTNKTTGTVGHFVTSV
jgi:hypothetical protein